MADVRGSCTCQHLQLNHWLHLLKVIWSSNDEGYTQQVVIPCRINGNIICVDTVPGLGIADDYDISLTDELGMDVMGGTLANRDDTNGERAWPTDGTYVIRRRVYNCLQLEVTNASIKATGGYINIYFERKNLEGV